MAGALCQVPDNRPLEAPLTGQDASRISEVLGTGITIHGNPKNLMLMNEKISAVILAQRLRRCRGRRSPRSGEARRIAARPMVRDARFECSSP